MSDVPLTRGQLFEALNGIADGQATAQQLTSNLRRTLLDFGSETPDNLNCARRVEVGPVGSEIGPKITGRDVLFRDIAHNLESEPLPEALKDIFPNISEEDWDAFTRMTTLIYILLTPDISPNRPLTRRA
jgi:hypothetical protein